jgi:hypothetical protein
LAFAEENFKAEDSDHRCWILGGRSHNPGVERQCKRTHYRSRSLDRGWNWSYCGIWTVDSWLNDSCVGSFNRGQRFDFGSNSYDDNLEQK